MIVEHRVGRDHRFIIKPQFLHIIFGIVTKPRNIACLWEADWRCAFGVIIIADFDLIEPFLAAFNDIKVFEQAEAGNVIIIRTADQRFPLSGLFQVSRRYAEIDMVIIGQDINDTIAHIDAVLPAFLAW